MYYGNIKEHDVANGNGVRVSLFVSGCRNHCKGCFQPETWDFDYGMPYTKETQERIIEASSKEYIKGLTLLGGDPFEEENAVELIGLCAAFRMRFRHTKDIWAFSGYTIEEIEDNRIKSNLLKYIDILVDGRFILEQKDLMLKFRGSRNQRIIDVRTGRVISDGE